MNKLAMAMVLMTLGDQACKAGHMVNVEMSWISITVWRHYKDRGNECDHFPIYDCIDSRISMELFNEAVAFLNGLIANPVEDMEEAA
jgi:hypothetical protein